MARLTLLLKSIVCFLPGAHLTGPVETNVALSKPTMQSGTNGASYSFKAVDGEQGGCIYTNGGNAWWLVDLLHVYNISAITVSRRTITVDLVKIEGSVWHPFLCPASSPKVCVNQMGSTTVSCEQEVMARYVKVSSTSFMTFCEVQVFGQKVDTCLNTGVQIQNGRKRDIPSGKKSSLTSSRNECSSICYRHNCLFFNYNRATGECQRGSDITTSASSNAAADWDLGTVC